MAQQRISRLLMDRLTLPPIAVVIVFVFCFVLNVGVALFSAYSPSAPILGIIGALGINLVVFLFLQPRWAMPACILLSLPTIVVTFPVSAGILSRLYVGNLLLALALAIGALRAIPSQRKAGQSVIPASLMFPLIGLAVAGIISILYSRLDPDPRVTYSFPHSDAPILVVNATEMLLLLGLPVILIILPKLIRTVADAKWIVRAYCGMGLVYALGTIFAGPLHLYGQNVLLGNSRPLVLGLESSTLGIILVLIANIALGQALYESTKKTRFYWWVLTFICGVAVIMAFGRTAWLALLLSVLVMLGFHFKKVYVLLLVPLFLLPFLIPGVSDFFNPDKVYGIDRLVGLQDAIAIWQTHPLFGIGAGNYQFFDIAYGADIIGIAHNQYLEVLAEMGVPGLICFMWSIVVIGWLTLQRFKTAVTSQGKAIALAYIGTYATLVFTGFFASSFLPSAAGAGGTIGLLLESYYWILLGVVITMPQWEKSVQVAAEANQPVVNPPQATGLRSS